MLQRFPGKVSFSKYSPQTDYLDSISLLTLSLSLSLSYLVFARILFCPLRTSYID